MSIGARIPWQAKLAAYLVLARIPGSYDLFRRFGLFRRGKMEEPQYAFNVFKMHFDRAGFSRRDGGSVALELGPGDSAFSALIARDHGAAGTYLVDVSPLVLKDLTPYRSLAAFLSAKGLPAPGVGDVSSLEELLTACSAQHLTSGLASLRSIPAGSVDFAWSQAVLEHVRRADFLDTMREFRRVLRDDGICSHRVDLRDHLAYALNNLRFSERMWESDFMVTDTFYTNRIRYSAMLDLFRKAGFNVEVVQEERWDRLPTPRGKLAPPFRELPDDELSVRGFHVLLRPA